MTRYANLLLDVTNKLAPVDVEKMPSMRKRIPAKLLAAGPPQDAGGA